MTDHTAALREALWVCVEHNALHFGESHNTVIQGRAALSTPPAPASQGDSDECAEILSNLIANIEENGLYSEEGMLTFLTQALSCLKPANPAPQQPAQGWMPIETAPKDGTYILLTNAECGGSWVGHFQQFAPSGFRFANPWHSMMLNHWHLPNKKADSTPTHWMPLPAAPAMSAAQDAAQGDGNG